MRSIAKRGTTLEFMILPEPPRRGRTGTQWRYETGWADGGWSRNLEGQYRSWDYEPPKWASEGSPLIIFAIAFFFWLDCLEL